MRPGDTLPPTVTFMPDAEYVRGYDDGWDDHESLSSMFSNRAFGLGIIAGMIFGLLFALAGGPR